MLGWCQCSFMKWDWVVLQRLICLFRLRELAVLWPWRSAIVRYDFFCRCLTKPEFTTSASARVASRAAALTQNTTSKWISMSANSLLWLIRNVCAHHAAQGETTNGTRAAHQRRLNPDLFLALWLPVNHCCSFQRGEWISSAPGIQRLILNCLADNFCIIAGS